MSSKTETPPLTLSSSSHKYVLHTLERATRRAINAYGFEGSEIYRRHTYSEPLDMIGIKKLLAQKQKDPDTLIDYRIYMLVEVPKTDGYSA